MYEYRIESFHLSGKKRVNLKRVNLKRVNEIYIQYLPPAYHICSRAKSREASAESGRQIRIPYTVYIWYMVYREEDKKKRESLYCHIYNTVRMYMVYI